MNRTLRWSACAAVIAILSSSHASLAGPHTRVRLLADARTIVPGEPFTVGILMTMQKGWHTYWKNPGEAGLPTSVLWTAPPGFTPGDILWPLPHKLIETGDVLTYGYADENMLLVPFRVPPTVAPGTSVTISAKLDWLECEHTCVPGEATVRLTLPVGVKGGGGAHEELFAKYRGLIPSPYSPGGEITLTTGFAKSAIEIRLAPAGAAGLVIGGEGAPDFFPEPLNDVVIGRIQVSVAAGVVSMRVPLSVYQPVAGPLTLRGVLLYAIAGSVPRAESVEVRLPPEFCATLSTGGEARTSLLDQTFETGRGMPPVYTFFLFALIGGLLLNIMPCVLPVIALKVFGLVRMAGDQPARIKRLGLSFCAGILASFLALALVVILLQLAGQQVGWGFQFQEPLFVIAMAAVVFAFGLSLFGVFEVQLPGAAVSGISSMVTQQQGGTGYGASFAEGVFATILATPCTAPFLGSALGFAFSQPWWMILLIFASVALGMSLPYLILTARPAWLRYLPRPGEWMVTAKQFMGFLMMATLLWLLYILGKQLGMEAVIWTGAFLIAVGIACWLVGRFATLAASRPRSRLTWIAAVAIVVTGYVVFLESALDIRSLIAGVPAATEAVQGEGITWTPFTLAGLEADIRGDRPVFVDFTAEWCLTCKVNEKTVLNDRTVVGKFKELNVLAVKADWTNRNPDITKLLAKFGRSGVPLYVIFAPGRPNTPIVLPEVITAGMVVEALGKGAGS